MIPKRTDQYRINKLGALRLHRGELYLPQEVDVGIACGDRTVIHTTREGQEVFATGFMSEAHANVRNTKAYATQLKTKAYAHADKSIAIATHEHAIAYAMRKGAKAIATYEGARANTGANTDGEAQEDFIQNVWPNNNRPLESTIS
jgi:hypothetical protein